MAKYLRVLSFSVALKNRTRQNKGMRRYLFSLIWATLVGSTAFCQEPVSSYALDLPPPVADGLVAPVKSDVSTTRYLKKQELVFLLQRGGRVHPGVSAILVAMDYFHF